MHSPSTPARTFAVLTARIASRRVVWLLVLWCCFPACAFSQLYRADEVDRRALSFRTNVNNSLNDPAAYAAAKDREFTEYFTKAFFPTMTQTDPVALSKLVAQRDDLFKRILLATNNRQLQTDLTATIYRAVLTIIASSPGNPPQPPYHPAVRYNAVLILGMLDAEYANQGGTAKPLPAATTALTKIVDAATTSAIFPPSVIVGALVGLERHAQLQPTPQTADAMTAAVLKLVLRDEPIQEVDSDVHDWMRLRAARVLALLGTVGQDNQSYNALLQLTTKLKSLDARCEAAALLAKLKYDGAKVDGAVTAEQLLKLTADVGEAELARAIDFEGKPAGAGFSAGREGGRRYDPGDSAADAADLYPRRPLVAHLDGLKQSLMATRPLVPAETQTKFDAILTAITPVIDAAMNKDTVELAVASRVREMSAALKRIGASAAPAAAAPVDEFK